MRKTLTVITLLLTVIFCSFSQAVSAVSSVGASSETNGSSASVFVGEGLFFDFEKKLKVEDSADYFFTSENMSYATFEERYLPLILKLLESGYDSSYSVFFSFGEEDTENPFAFPMGVGAEIAALLNELKALYPDVDFYFTDVCASKSENTSAVQEMNETVAKYCLCPSLNADVSSETGLSEISEVRASAFAVLTAFEKLNTSAGQGDSGILFADGTGYLFKNGSFLAEKTGLVEIQGTGYFVENGIFKPEYCGLSELLGETYYVNSGIIDRLMNDTISIGGYRYTFENGKMVSKESEYKNYTPEELHAMKAVFLTFDDGPSPVTTQVLDIMDRYHVKATFFVTKQTVFEDVLKDAAARGHAIAVHTASHDYDTIYASFDAWKADFDEVYNWIYELTGVKPTAYRFPGGSNTKRPTAEDKQKMKDYVHELGMEYYDWNVVTGDGDWRVTAEEELTNATSEIDYRTVPVILAHDQDHNKSTAEALDSILKELTGRGYHFMTLEPGIPPVQQGTNWDY